ncbi:MAG: acetate/propionate family kinase [Pseudomonadota bacterium]|jgi:acetate kinase
MVECILVLNAGSSSLKFSLFSQGDDADLVLTWRGQVEGMGTRSHFIASNAAGEVVAERRWPDDRPLDHEAATDVVLEWLSRHDGQALAGVGHRVVHGGTVYDRPVRIDGEAVRRLQDFIPLAPLHQPHNLSPIKAILARAPELPQVACFDTSFHRAQPEVAQSFALPPDITGRGVHRFGFHGLSYEYIAAALPGIDPRAAQGRTVVAHLGNGASMCAMRDCRSVASTMGFTALDGLPMGTRCGALDPGVILYLLDELHMSPREIEHLLYHRSGFLGVSGVSSDMRTLLASAEPGAARAVDLFVHRIGRELGSLAAALGGLDALVFTAGIGEHAAPIRERVCRDAAWLGVKLDAAANRAGGPRISTADSAVSVWVIPTNEELMIARHVRQLLA